MKKIYKLIQYPFLEINKIELLKKETKTNKIESSKKEKQNLLNIYWKIFIKKKQLNFIDIVIKKIVKHLIKYREKRRI